MPDINQVFASDYLKAVDIPKGQAATFTIESASVEEIGEKKDKKIVLHFSGTDKKLVCNKTNAETIAYITGQTNTDFWGGSQINLVRGLTQFAGKATECIRVSDQPVMAPAPQPPVQQAVPMQPQATVAPQPTPQPSPIDAQPYPPADDHF